MLPFIEKESALPCFSLLIVSASTYIRNSEQNEGELFDSIAEDSSFYDATAGGGNCKALENLNSLH